MAGVKNVISQAIKITESLLKHSCKISVGLSSLYW